MSDRRRENGAIRRCTAEDLARAGKEMRDAQRAYFTARRRVEPPPTLELRLRRSRELEQRFDALVDAVLEPGLDLFVKGGEEG